jgi:hypothetical protein
MRMRTDEEIRRVARVETDETSDSTWLGPSSDGQPATQREKERERGARKRRENLWHSMPTSLTRLGGVF